MNHENYNKPRNHLQKSIKDIDNIREKVTQRRGMTASLTTRNRQIIKNEAYIYFFLEANLKVLLKKKIDMMKLVEAL